jgi:hypothetical protein
LSGARVPANVQLEIKSRVHKELDAGVTRRSPDELDYTNFGELSVVIISNWDIFGGLFNSKKAVEKVMASLNALRNPIVHCSPSLKMSCFGCNLQFVIGSASWSNF